MIKRKTYIQIFDFPAELHGLLQSGPIYDSSCSSDATTLYCDAGYYIKIDEKGTLATEAAMAMRFSAMGLGVSVVHYLSADRDYLVTRSAPGEDLTHFSSDPKMLCRVLADALRRLHAQPVTDAPVSARLRRYLDSADGDYSGGFYDESVLMNKYPVVSKQAAWEIMQVDKTKLKADTMIHGDACLPNVICHDGALTAFVDLGLAGAGDKHIDLYWAIWSLQYNLKTDQYTDYFLDHYGRENFDESMLQTIAAFELFG